MTKRKVNILNGRAIGLLLFLSWFGQVFADPRQTEVNIGVLALRGEAHALSRWQPTVDYLNAELSGYRFNLVPLGFEQVEPAVRDQQIDFVLANSAYYVRLERRYGVSRLATLRNRSSRGAQTMFSSAMIRKAGRSELRTFSDLGDSRVAAVDSRSLGGYLMIAGAMLEQGVDVQDDVADLVWMHTHDAVVYALLSGEADVGIVRSETLERMAQEGRIQMGDFALVSPVVGTRFPFLRSTRLYPEWPMAALEHVDTRLRDRLALTLLQMPCNHPAAKQGNHMGWVIPRNYQRVHELLRLLRVSPYDKPVGFYEVFAAYRYETLLALLLVLTVLVYAELLRRKNRHLLATQQALSSALDSEQDTMGKLSEAVADLGRVEHRFSQLAEISSDGIVLIDILGRVVFANRAAASILGYRQSELHAALLHELVVPDNLRDRAARGFAHFQQTGEGELLDQRIEVTARQKSGKMISIELSISALQEGHERFAIGIFRDITERQHLLSNLRENQENFRNIVDKNRTGILLLDDQGKVLFCNQSAKSMLDRDRESLVGSHFGAPASLDVRQEINVVRADGDVGVAEMLYTRTEWKGLPAYLVMLHDVTPYREAQEKIKNLAFFDSLTDLPNRHHLTQELTRALQRHRRSGTAFALLFLDLDKFKEVNDTLGHEAGDQLLIEVSQRLRGCVRSSDFVARMGGDEFTVILEDFDGDAIAKLAEKMGERIRQPITINQSELFVDVSIGCSVFPEDSSQADELLKQADTAMYKAKREGSGFARYSGGLGNMLARSARTEEELHRALEGAEFEMYYQVQMDLHTQKPMAYEALIRWNHSSGQIILPVDFIPSLENSGLFVPLGRWVLESVCRQLRDWLDIEGGRALPVAVNISSCQLERDQLVDFVKDLLKRYRLPPDKLVIEISEGVLLSGADQVISQLNQLCSLGLALHLDDFGTGYSSLTLLKRLPFSVIKIDHSFVHDIESDEADLGLIRAAIAMARGLGVKTLAEGVERPQQLKLLREIGCDYAQGYLFGKPAPVSGLSDILARLV